MKCLADTNTYLAVALDEPERQWLTAATQGVELVGPTVLFYEVGNALSALVKRGRLDARQAIEIWEAVRHVPVELVDVDIGKALELAVAFDLYAYDAYFLQCTIELRCPILTLDRSMQRTARQLKIRLLEKP